MSARKKIEVVEEMTDDAGLPEGTVLADDARLGEGPGAGTAVEATFDPELDQVPEDASDESVSEDASAPSQHKGKGKLVTGVVVALVVAAGAVWAASALGGSGEVGLPESVADPSVVIAALEKGGIECSGTAVSGDVATCSATTAVRVFASPDEADKWAAALLKDPLTSSAIGWVRHGNVVVVAPLNSAPDIAGALGAGSQIY